MFVASRDTSLVFALHLRVRGTPLLQVASHEEMGGLAGSDEMEGFQVGMVVLVGTGVPAYFMPLAVQLGDVLHQTRTSCQMTLSPGTDMIGDSFVYPEVMLGAAFGDADGGLRLHSERHQLTYLKRIIASVD